MGGDKHVCPVIDCPRQYGSLEKLQWHLYSHNDPAHLSEMITPLRPLFRSRSASRRDAHSKKRSKRGRRSRSRRPPIAQRSDKNRAQAQIPRASKSGMPPPSGHRREKTPHIAEIIDLRSPSPSPSPVDSHALSIARKHVRFPTLSPDTPSLASLPHSPIPASAADFFVNVEQPELAVQPAKMQKLGPSWVVRTPTPPADPPAAATLAAEMAARPALSDSVQDGALCQPALSSPDRELAQQQLACSSEQYLQDSGRRADNTLPNHMEDDCDDGLREGSATPLAALSARAQDLGSPFRGMGEGHGARTGLVVLRLRAPDDDNSSSPRRRDAVGTDKPSMSLDADINISDPELASTLAYANQSSRPMAALRSYGPHDGSPRIVMTPAVQQGRHGGMFAGNAFDSFVTFALDVYEDPSWLACFDRPATTPFPKSHAVGPAGADTGLSVEEVDKLVEEGPSRSLRRPNAQDAVFDIASHNMGLALQAPKTQPVEGDIGLSAKFENRHPQDGPFIDHDADHARIEKPRPALGSSLRLRAKTPVSSHEGTRTTLTAALAPGLITHDHADSCQLHVSMSRTAAVVEAVRDLLDALRPMSDCSCGKGAVAE